MVAVQAASNGNSRVTPITSTEPAVGSDVLAAARGDAAAFERLVKENQSLVCSIALAVSRNIEESEDIAQDTFVAAWQRLGQLRNPASFRPWLRQLTRNRANDAVRSRLRKRLPVTAVSDDIAQSVRDLRSDAREKLISAQQRAVLAEALDRLPSLTREILVLYYREDKSISQVAALLDLNETTVKKRLSRGRERLRQAMEPVFDSTLTQTVPGLVFTGGVIAAVSFGAPAASTAAGLAIAAKVGTGAAASAAKWASAIPGLLGGLVAIRTGLMSSLKEAQDDEERRGHYWVAALGSLSVLAFVLLVNFSEDVHRKPAYAMAVVFGYWLAMMGIYFGLSRLVTRRRLTLAYLENPELEIRDKRKLKRVLALSVVILIVIMGGLLWGFHLKGLL